MCTLLGIKAVLRCTDFRSSRNGTSREAAAESPPPAPGLGPCVEIYEMSPLYPRFHAVFRRPLEHDKIDLQLHTDSVAPWA